MRVCVCTCVVQQGSTTRDHRSRATRRFWWTEKLDRATLPLLSTCIQRVGKGARSGVSNDKRDFARKGEARSLFEHFSATLFFRWFKTGKKHDLRRWSPEAVDSVRADDFLHSRFCKRRGVVPLHHRTMLTGYNFKYQLCGKLMIFQ